MRWTWLGARSGLSLMTTSPPVESVRVRRSASAIGRLRSQGHEGGDLGMRGGLRQSGPVHRRAAPDRRRGAQVSESEHIAAAHPEDSVPDSVVDEEDRLRPEFVDKVLDAVEAGDDETARKLVQPLHPADVADLIELAARDEREPQQVADIAGQLETDDAVALIEDLDRHEQQAVLERMEPDDRAAVEEALSYPE